MRSIFTILLVSLVAVLTAQPQNVMSPDGNLMLTWQLTAKGEPTYKAMYKGKQIVADSKLGLYTGAGQLVTGFKQIKAETAKADETWKPVWGEVAQIRNQYQQLTVKLENATGKLNIIFRVFNDGIGFRYEFPQDAWKDEIVIREESSEFHMTADHTTWWQAGDWDSNEHRYMTTPISGIDGRLDVDETNICTMFVPDYRACQTPVTMKTATGVHVAIHEAALVNYPAMQLKVDPTRFCYTSFLVPSASPGRKAGVPPGFKTPWRTLQITANAAGLLESKLILNLNDPCAFKDVSWIHPVKYVGIWWEMHLGKSSWDYAGSQDAQNAGQAARPHGHHGATTENTRRYIDFASTHGFNGVLVEGWNTGWESWFGQWKEDVFDFQTPYPDYDLKALAQYSIDKKAPIIVHHETSGSASGYDKHVDKAFDLMKSLGLNAIKSGYVGRIIPRGEYHDGQWMVNHYNRIIEKAAAKQIMVDAHEPVRPTGLHRTYPNFMACEATRGNEFNAWSRGNLPEHETILPFTRGLGGPIDYTPGIFDIKFEKYKQPGNTNQVHTTIAKQLALYVTMYSPLQMAADLPENYERNIKAFQFIKDVAVDWDDTRVLLAEIGDFVTIARKAKGTANWFVGGITDENKRMQIVDFSFLDQGVTYKATIYEDAPDADWQKNPTAIAFRTMTVTKETRLEMHMAPGGGFAIMVTKE